MKKINTGLYGGKSFLKGVPDSKYIERSVYCDNYENCSFYKEGKCLRVTNGFNQTNCKYGSNGVIEGYTPKAKKSSEFVSKVKNDPVYNKLKYPCATYAAKVGDYLFLDTTFLKVKEENGETVIDRDSSFIARYIFINADDIELLVKILKATPIKTFGYEVEERYQKEVVPAILTDLRRNVPDIFKTLVTKYPEFDTIPDYVGREAYVYTLADGSVLEDTRSTYTYDKTNGTLTGITREYVLGKYVDVSITAKVDPTMTCKITDNSQVTEETLFC